MASEETADKIVILRSESDFGGVPETLDGSDISDDTDEDYVGDESEESDDSTSEVLKKAVVLRSKSEFGGKPEALDGSSL